MLVGYNTIELRTSVFHFKIQVQVFVNIFTLHHAG